MNRKIRTAFLVLILVSFMFMAELAFALDVKLTVVAEGLNTPVELITSPDGTKRRFIIEHTGAIKILMSDGSLLAIPFLDLSDKIVKQVKAFDERGLLGMAFHPNYKNNGKFYVYYSAPYQGGDLAFKFLGDHISKISEFKVSDNNPNVANPASEKTVLEIKEPQFNHDGGALHFGPDGHLFIGVGDGGNGDDWGYGHHRTMGNGQDLNSLLGKILRIDVDKGDPYESPESNPFFTQEDARPEIWAYGLRNPWRMRFDMGGQHQLFVADVQQNSFEEVNIVTKGGNYGWRVKEGLHCFNHLDPNIQKSSCASYGMTDPIFEYKNCTNFPKDCKGTSISGGAVYRGSVNAWQGKYFFGDWTMSFGAANGHLYVASEKEGKWEMEDVNITNMKEKTTFLAVAQDGDGEIYALTSKTMGPGGGKDIIYKITE